MLGSGLGLVSISVLVSELGLGLGSEERAWVSARLGVGVSVSVRVRVGVAFIARLLFLPSWRFLLARFDRSDSGQVEGIYHQHLGGVSWEGAPDAHNRGRR